jgi:7-cyano-7-deazaguanine synthase
MSQTPAVAVLVSGGIDSAVLSVHLLRAFPQVFPLYIRSGLRWESAELASLGAFFNAVMRDGLESLTVLDEPVADVYGTHWSTGGVDVPGLESADEAVYLPGRNVLLVAKAAVWCSLRGIGTLALACLKSNPFPDSTPEFFEKLESVLEDALPLRVRLIRPFDTFSKSEVLVLGKGLPLHVTYSCISPVRGQHCGACNKCGERQRGFRDAGLPDLTVYAS